MTDQVLERRPRHAGEENAISATTEGPELKPIRDVVFVHIPKTAGTSLRNMLAAGLSEATHIFDYGHNTAAIGGAFTDEERTPENILAIRNKLLPQQKRIFVCGHFPVGKYLGAFHPASCITFLRHPIERLLSAHRHYVAHLGYKGSLAEFVEERGQINLQSKLLWGIDLHDMGFVGITEAMPEMLSVLSRHLGIELANRRDNVGKGRSAPVIEPDLRARIEALHADDLRLYQYVVDNLDYFTNYRGRRDERFTLAKGKVHLTPRRTFRGWAVPSRVGHLVEVEVKLGSQVIHRFYADQFLPNPDKRKEVTNRVGGFLVDLPREMLAGQSQVRFVVAGTDKDLDGSPVALTG